MMLSWSALDRVCGYRRETRRNSSPLDSWSPAACLAKAFALSHWTQATMPAASAFPSADCSRAGRPGSVGVPDDSRRCTRDWPARQSGRIAPRPPHAGRMMARRPVRFGRLDRPDVSPALEKAERVASGVKVDANIVLRLIPGQDRAGGDRVLACCCQVLDGDIKMYLHLLIARAGRPHGRRVLRLGLERQAGAAVVGTQLHPAGLILLHLPAQQTAVEVGQRACIGRV